MSQAATRKGSGVMSKLRIYFESSLDVNGYLGILG